MSKSTDPGIFETVVEPDLERIPLLEARHTEKFNGKDFIISQVVVKNILTDFDVLLSRHLAATKGAGFARYTVIVRFREDGGDWRSFEPTHHASVPHALRAIADRAVSFGREQGLTLREAGRGAHGSPGREIRLEREDVNSLTDALAVCETVGEPEFMEVSGDFEIVMVKPSPTLDPIVMYLRKGSVTVPSAKGGGSPFECPIAGFARGVAKDMGAQGYLATARHALAVAKEKAVSDFRAEAERQILSFDRALSGRPLDGHRFDLVSQLIARLRAGLGDSLRGLSASARITAMDWSQTVEQGGFSRGRRMNGGETVRKAAFG